jgi:hypothetical protein
MRMLSSIRCQFHNPISGAHCVVLLYRLWRCQAFTSYCLQER